jgi:acetolactate synthase small subunit
MLTFHLLTVGRLVLLILSTEREAVLLKLQAPPGPTRTEVLQIAQIFRARVNDVSDNTLTLCVSGDPGKVSDTRLLDQLLL